MITLHAETLRLVDHFLRAEKLVSTREPAQLDDAQRLVRQLLLDEVAFYRSQRRFPKNHDSEAMRPTFIDAQGTPCAMAHLLQVGGASVVADRISRERNHQLVPQLASDPEFAAWLSAAGLTVEEASLIQPSYGCTSPAECVCNEGASHPGGAVVPAKAVLQALVQSGGEARIEKVFGETTWRVGDFVKVSGVEGTHVLIGIDSNSIAFGTDAGQPFTGIGLGSDEKYSCISRALTSDPKPISAEVYAAAVMAADCKATLAELEPEYAGNPCALRDAVGCSGAPASASVGILLAVVGAILARRLR